MSVDEMVIKWSMDSKQFNDGLTAMNRNMNVLKSGFTATDTKLKAFGNSTDQLKNKQEYLTKAMELQKLKIDNLKNSYDKQVQATGANSKEAQNLAVKLNNQIGYYNRLESELKQTNSALDIQTSKWNKMSKVMENVSSKMKNFGSKMNDVGNKLTVGLTAPIIALGTASFNMASDMDESINKVEVACGSGADEVKKFSDTTLKSFGIAKGTSLDMMATFADMGNGMGLESKKANEMSMSLVGLAGDLASFKNVKVEVAKTALNGIYTGETESLKQLGIVMTEANLQEFAYSKGIKKKLKDMTQSEKVQLRYNYVMEKTKNAQGDFAKTSDGAANQQRIFTESLKQLGATLGQNLLPVITPFIKKLNDIVEKFGALDKDTQQNILKFGAFALAIGPLAKGLGGLIKFGGGVASIFGTVSKKISEAGGMISFLSSPIGIAILAIGAIIAVGVALYKNWDTIKEKASELGERVSQKMEDMKQAVRDKLDSIKNFFSNLHLPEIKIPHIKMPHFNITGEFSLKPPSIPHFGVDWYWNGGILDKPTIFGNGIGVGDSYKGMGRQQEAIIPLSQMYSNIRDIVRDERSIQPIQVNVVVSNNMDNRAIGKAVTTQVKKEITRESNNYRKCKGGLAFG